MSRDARRQGALETNLTRWGGWDVSASAPSPERQGKDFLGVVARSQGAQLGPLELDVFSWLTARWFEQGGQTDGIVRCTLYELGSDMYGRKPSGKEIRLLRRAIENLAGALITLGGFDAHSGKMKPKLASMVHLIESAVWGEDLPFAVPTRADAAQTGGMRGSTYELKLASWLIPQFQRRYITYLDWQIQRKLDGLAKRLWVYLEAEQFKTTGDGVQKSYIILGEKAYTALGVNHARERDRRTALQRAGRRIVEVDMRYLAVEVESNPVNRSGWRILATRVTDRERHAVRTQIRTSLTLAPDGQSDS